MNRKWTATLWIVALTLAVVTVACGPKEAPVTEPEIEVEEPEVVEEPTPPPAPPVVKDPKPEWWSDDLAIATDKLKSLGLIGDVYFDLDKYDLKDDARERLARNAAFMRENPQMKFMVEGHCDERGTNEYNLALGERRANGATSYLASLGIDGSRLRTISYGEERPACLEHNEGCWWKNRRATFLVVDLGD